MSFDISDLMARSMVNMAGERPMEYLFAWTTLAALSPTMPADRGRVRVLDVGGAESRLAKTLAELGFDVAVIDINDVDHGRAKFVRANILEYDFPEECFDVIIAISTIEHVGLPAYGQKVLDPDGDIKAMRKLYRWLRRGGFAIVTVPYGRPHHPPDFERVYNRETLGERILSGGWEVVSALYLAQHIIYQPCTVSALYFCQHTVWQPCTRDLAEGRDGCVCLLLRKPGVVP
jgi:SAM-dependent methyltransferase